MVGTATLSTATGNTLLGSIVSGAGFVSLHTANPGLTGTSELSSTGYARQALTLTSASAKATHNNATITFGPAVGDWPAATYYGLWSLVSGGTFLGGGPLNASKTVLDGDTASIASSGLALQIS